MNTYIYVYIKYHLFRLANTLRLALKLLISREHTLSVRMRQLALVSHDVIWRPLSETRKWVARCCLCSVFDSRLCFPSPTASRSRAEMAAFISVPLKKSSEVDLVKPLGKFVTATYQASDEQAEYHRAVEELNKLRKNALGRPLDKHESSLEILLRYNFVRIGRNKHRSYPPCLNSDKQIYP